MLRWQVGFKGLECGRCQAEALQVSNQGFSVSLDENGMPDGQHIAMLSHNGTSEAAAETSVEAARRAINVAG